MTGSGRSLPLAGLVAAVALPLLALGVAPAAAKDTGGSSSSPTIEQQCATQTGASSGTEYRKCVKKKKQTSLINDEARFEIGRDLARIDQDYDGAIGMLASMQNQKDPRALMMIGYSMRKSGRIGEAMDFYGRALAIDPNYVQTREYMGEALLEQGDLAGAKVQLTEIANRCGTTCESWILLDQEVQRYEAAKL